MSKSSSSTSSTSNTTIPTSPAETSFMEGLKDISPLKGLEGIDILPFIGILNMRGIVRSQYDKLQKGDSGQQYLIFSHVRADDLAKIDRARDNRETPNRMPHFRMAHYTDGSLLMVKLPSSKHERAYGNLANQVIWKVAAMGIPNLEFHFVGATLFHGRNSSKEADAAYNLYSLRPNDADWPTLVFECGFSETLNHLRFDAEWWLRESGGRVKIVIIISIKRARPGIEIEKWELAPITGRRQSLRASTIAASSNLNNPPPQNP